VREIELDTQQVPLHPAQAAHEESRARYVDLYESAPVAYLTLTRAGLITQVNLDGATLLGMARQNLLQRRFDRFIAPADLDRWHRHFRGLMHKDGGRRAEMSLQRKDGSTFPAMINLSLALTDGRASVIADVRDVSERKKAEDDFQRFFNLLPELACIATPDGHLLKSNPAWQQTLGYSEQELLCTSLLDFIHPDDREATRKAIQHELDGENIRSFINRYRQKQGGYKWLEWTSNPSEDKQLLFATARDITDRRQAEDALRESRDFAVSVLDSLDEHIAVLDEHGVITAVNQKWNRFAADNGNPDLGRTVAVGGNYFAACDLPPNDPESTSAAAAKAGIQSVLAGTAETFSMAYPCHSPLEQRWFEMRVSRLQSARPSVVVAHENITARIRADEAIRLRDVALEASATAMLTTDRHGVIVWANQAFSALTGYAVDEVVGRTPGELINSGKHDAAVYLEMWRTILGGAVWRGELINRRKDGSLYHEQQTITPVRDECGAISQFIAVKQDISERKVLEADLRDSEERYRSLVSATLDALLLTTTEGGILGANEAACRMFGHTEAELIRIGQAGIADLADPRLKPALEERARTSRFHGELRFFRADGAPFEGEVTSAVFRNRLGEARTSMVIRDVTERSQAEARLRQSEAQLHALTARLQAVREEERTRIARDVHDVLGQQLTGLTLDMAWLQKRLRSE
jgi:PAS domain S-box-containing protein